MDRETYSNFDKIFETYKKGINDRIAQLEEIISLTNHKEMNKAIAEEIRKLNVAVNVSLSDLGLSPVTKKPTAEFGKNDRKYVFKTTVNEYKGGKIDEKIASFGRTELIDAYNLERKAKIFKLKKKKAKITAKQLKINDKQLIKALNEYKKKQNIDFKKIDKFTAKFDKKKDVFFAETNAEVDTPIRVADPDTIDYGDKKAVKEYKQNLNANKRVSDRLESLKKKTGRIGKSLAKPLAKCGPSKIKQLKDRAAKLGKNISNAFYDWRLENFEEKISR